jgi:hypothetical protein
VNTAVSIFSLTMVNWSYQPTICSNGMPSSAANSISSWAGLSGKIKSAYFIHVGG